MNYRVLVILEKANRNYSAYAPDVPGCVATGKTIEDTLENMREALEIHLRSMAEDGDAMPEIATVGAQFLDIEVGSATRVERTNREASSFATGHKPEALAKEQGAAPVTGFDQLLGDFWPDDESADDFMTAVREWRHPIGPEGAGDQR